MDLDAEIRKLQTLRDDFEALKPVLEALAANPGLAEKLASDTQAAAGDVHDLAERVAKLEGAHETSTLEEMPKWGQTHEARLRHIEASLRLPPAQPEETAPISPGIDTRAIDQAGAPSDSGSG